MSLPGKITLPDGQILKITIFKVRSRWPNGTPKNCTLIPNDEEVDIVGGEEFITCYVRQEAFKGESSHG